MEDGRPGQTGLWRLVHWRRLSGVAASLMVLAGLAAAGQAYGQTSGQPSVQSSDPGFSPRPATASTTTASGTSSSSAGQPVLVHRCRWPTPDRPVAERLARGGASPCSAKGRQVGEEHHHGDQEQLHVCHANPSPRSAERPSGWAPVVGTHQPDVDPAAQHQQASVLAGGERIRHGDPWPAAELERDIVVASAAAVKRSGHGFD